MYKIWRCHRSINTVQLIQFFLKSVLDITVKIISKRTQFLIQFYTNTIFLFKTLCRYLLVEFCSFHTPSLVVYWLCYCENLKFKAGFTPMHKIDYGLYLCMWEKGEKKDNEVASLLELKQFFIRNKISLLICVQIKFVGRTSTYTTNFNYNSSSVDSIYRFELDQHFFWETLTSVPM